MVVSSNHAAAGSLPSRPTHPNPTTPIPRQLILRAINSSKSAFLAVTFSARFFDAYAVIGANVVQAGILLKARARALTRACGRVHARSGTLSYCSKGVRGRAGFSVGGGVGLVCRLPRFEP